MHLTNELNTQLKKIGSKVELGKTVYNEYPSNYAFSQSKKGVRNLRIDFGKSEQEFYAVFFTKNEINGFEICHLRGKFNSIKVLAEVTKMWIELEESPETVNKNFCELESFQSINPKNPDPKIEERWTYVENRIFNNTSYWKDKNWEKKYFDMIKMAKQEDRWKRYYPFTSHNRLRFSLNYELTYTWDLDLFIIPTMTKKKGDYYVSIPDLELRNGFTFKYLAEAIDFYATKLNTHKPTK